MTKGREFRDAHSHSHAVKGKVGGCSLPNTRREHSGRERQETGRARPPSFCTEYFTATAELEAETYKLYVHDRLFMRKLCLCDEGEVKLG